VPARRGRRHQPRLPRARRPEAVRPRRNHSDGLHPRLRGLTAEQIRKPLARDAQDVATYGTAENWLSANPAGFLGKHVPPALVIVAREERFMPPILEQGTRFVRGLLEADVPAELVIVPGRHMSSIESIGTPGDPTFAAIRQFIQSGPAAASRTPPSRR
jgi:acetyl esterase/lipase